MRNMIVLEDVSKEYGPNTKGRVINKISLIIKSGEFVSIIGPSGCGKTTLLNLVGGLLNSSSGKIKVNGKTPNLAREQRETGWVFQDPVLLPWRTLKENISLPSEIFNNEKPYMNLEQVIKLADLQDFEDYLPRDLSGGMKSRGALARTLLYNPQILLMDEPFAALDEITRERLQLEFMNILLSIKNTVLFVTHDIKEAVFLSDRVLIMSKSGTIKQERGIPFKRPRTQRLFVKRNFIHLVDQLRSDLAEDISLDN